MRRIIANHRYVIGLCLLYLLLTATTVFFFIQFDKGELQILLKRWLPWSLRCNLLLLILGILICRRDIHQAFRPLLSKKFLNLRGTALVVLLLVTLGLTALVAPRTHRIYYDEDIYANIGQNMALSHQTGYCSYGYFEYDEYYPRWITYNKEPSGWPFLISVVFTLCGVNELYAFFLNNLLLISSLLVVFFMVQNLGGGYAAAWMAALCLGLMPHNLIWSNTIAAEPASAFWTGAGMLLLIVFLNTRRTRHLMLWMLLLPMTCQMRPESALILPLSAVAILLSAPRTLLRKDFFACALPAALFLLPHMLHLYSVSDHSWGAEGAKFSLQFFSDNLRVNGPYYFNNREFPALFTLLALIGLFNTRLALSRRLLLLLWFNLFWGIFLFFYAGSYHYGADVRFALLSFMPLAVLAGYGGDMLRHVIAHRLSALDIPSAASVILLIIAAFTQFLPLIRQEGQEAWGARYDHDHAREFIQHIPRRSIVLTHNPTMFLLWGQNAIQTYAGRDKPDLIRHLMEKYNGNVYFHDNYWCNTHTERNQKLCGYIRRHYGLEKIVSAREQEYEYGLYRIKAVKSEP